MIRYKVEFIIELELIKDSVYAQDITEIAKYIQLRSRYLIHGVVDNVILTSIKRLD